MEHDFKKFPELTNSQMGLYYFDSPHQQIAEDFDAKVVKVHDGDTITLQVDWRDFNFPLRFSNIMAAELNEENGKAARDHLAEMILGETVRILIDKKNRVGKYGRLLGQVNYKGFDMGEQMKQDGYAIGVWQDQMGIEELILLGAGEF